MTRKQRPASAKDRVGVWIFGARGGLATTLMVGARAMARGLATPRGMLTETELCADAGLVPLASLEFGGHELRDGSLADSARDIQNATGTIPHGLLQKLGPDLRKIDQAIRRGTVVNAGATITKLTAKHGTEHSPVRSLRAEVDRIERDIRDFMRSKRLSRCVCVNLTSTEPKLTLTSTHSTPARLDAAIDADRRSTIRPSTLYAYAAAKLGLPFVHFTPSNATLIPAITQMFEAQGTPFMGADGKTGETLVKSALAPMFKYRDLRVLSWQGYNILGDRDGVVLADDENKRAKVESKDALLTKILGYPLHTHVGIDYVPSLDDLKTAWDFVHFQGFLDFKMSLQFTWQGCDAILAAPIVLDMVRFAELAARRGEGGSMPQLACFFKKPFGVDEHDLHQQWHMLTRYLAQLGSSPA